MTGPAFFALCERTPAFTGVMGARAAHRQAEEEKARTRNIPAGARVVPTEEFARVFPGA